MNSAPAALVMLLAIASAPARGGEEAAWTSAAQALEAARSAERAGLPVEEAAACRAVLDLAPTGPEATVCEARLQWLAQRADPDGGHAGLARLEAARRDADSRDDMLRALAEDDTVGVAVRAEAATALARASLREGKAAEALAWTEPWWRRPGVPADTRRSLGRQRVQALVALGRVDEAREVEAASGRAVGEVALELRAQRRIRAARISGGLLGAWALVAVPLGLAGWARTPRPRPLGLVPLGIVGLGGLVLAGTWEPLIAADFAVLLGLLVVTHLLSVGVASRLLHRPRLRRVAGAANALATLALAFLFVHLHELHDWVGL